MVKELVDNGAQVSHKAKDNSTPILSAIQKGFLNVVTYLVGKNSRVDCRGGKFNYTALDLALEMERKDIADVVSSDSVPLPARNNQMQYAAENGFPKTITYLIDHGISPNAKGEDGLYPIHRAAMMGQLDCIDLLLANKVPIDFKNSKDWTPLHYATYFCHADCAKYLLDHGANKHAITKDGFSLLQTCTHPSLSDLFNEFLPNKDLVKMKTSHNEIALHFAARNGNCVAIKQLVEAGLDIHAKDRDGWSPLHFAVDKNHIEAVDLFLDLGCDIAAEEKDGWFYLSWAADKGLNDMCKHLIERGADPNRLDKYQWSAMTNAIHRNHPDTLKILLENGADPNLKHKNACTPLHYAAEHGKAKCLKILIDKGASINHQNSNRMNALHFAARGGHLDCVKTLLRFGSKIGMKGNKKHTALYEALENGHFDVADYLIEKGANVNSIEKDDKYILYNFYEEDKTDICKYLIQHGAGEVKEKKDQQATTLYDWCMENNDMQFAEFLLANGLSVNVKGFHGRTPLHAAAATDNIDFARWLLEHGADVNAKSDKGKAPLYKAKSNEMKELLTSYGGEKCRI